MNQITTISNPREIFKLLIIYRWLSLLPPLIFVLLSFGSLRIMLSVLIAVLLNVVVSFWARSLNQILRQYPGLLAIEFVAMTVMMVLTDTWPTPYYLYSLSPLLVAAFFFHVRGAMLATTAFLPFYGVAVLTCMRMNGHTPDWVTLVGSVVGYYLISGIFGYASALLNQLHMARNHLADVHQDLANVHQNLARAHQDLEVLHDLTLSLQKAADVEEVQERVLEAITDSLGFKRTVVGLVDEKQALITGWLGRVREGNILSTTHQGGPPFSPEGGLVARALLERRICRADGPCTADDWLNKHFGMHGCLILPMYWGMQPIGVLLVDVSGADEEPKRLRSLEAIAEQTAAILGMMTTRLRRAKESAIQEERARIALDMHDTAAQSLFGIVCALDGCTKLAPTHPDVVASELPIIRDAAEGVRQEIRHLIHDMWPEAITAEAFETDLRHYITDVLQTHHLTVDFDVRGDFTSLTPLVRRTLYRVCQEALTNTVHHAAATDARICVDVVEGCARLVIRDNGRGFEPIVALKQKHEDEHFGLRGIQERVHSLHGVCDIFSQPMAGTSIVIDIPAQGG